MLPSSNLCYRDGELLLTMCTRKQLLFGTRLSTDYLKHCFQYKISHIVIPSCSSLVNT